MLSLLLLGAHATLPIERDVRLARPCTFWERSIDLDSLAQRASQVGGLTLSVDPRIRDLRVILFAEQRPLGQPLAKVADCLDLAWRRSGDGYLLYRTREFAEAQNGFLSVLKRDADQALDEKLAEWRNSPFVSARDGRERIARVDEAIKRLEATSSREGDFGDRQAALYREWEELRSLLGVAHVPVIALVKAM